MKSTGRRGFLKGLVGLAMVPVMPTLAVAAKIPVIKKAAVWSQDKLWAKMALELQREIDKQIIHDLRRLAEGKEPEVFGYAHSEEAIAEREKVVITPRRLKSKWTIEVDQDLKHLHHG